MSERQDRNSRLQLAQALKGGGLMMVLLCGLCTATCAGPSAYRELSGGGGQEETFYLGLAVMIGAVPILVGLLLFVGGVLTERAIKREQTPKPPRASPPPQ